MMALSMGHCRIFAGRSIWMEKVNESASKIRLRWLRGLWQFSLAQDKQFIATWCLRSDLIPYWLAIVPTKRMKPEKKARIDFYQEQVGDVLGRLFGAMVAPATEISLATQNPLFAEGL